MLRQELARIAFFEEFSAEALASLAVEARPIALPAGTELVRQGEVNEVVYVLLSGRVELKRRHPDLLEPVVLAELGPGEVIGLPGASDPAISAVGVTALECTKALALSAKAVAEAIRQSPALTTALLPEPTAWGSQDAERRSSAQEGGAEGAMK